MTDGERGAFGVVSTVLTSLPAQFAVLLLVNVLIVGGLFWHLTKLGDARERVLVQLIEACEQHGR